MRNTRTLIAIISLLLPATGFPAAEPGALPEIETHYIGFKGNGTGVFPGDCTPVTTWKKYDSKTATDGKGKPKLVADKSKPNPVNIAWKTQLPKSVYYGNNSSVIVAGGKVFALAEQTFDSLGPLLFCLDPQEGKILWQADCKHIDSLPEDKKEQTRGSGKSWYLNFAAAKDPKLISMVDKREMEFPGEINVWGYGEQPFLSGNRIFLRKCHNDPWVYCMGNPKEPARLSAIHSKPLPPVGK